MRDKLVFAWVFHKHCVEQWRLHHPCPGPLGADAQVKDGGDDVLPFVAKVAYPEEV
jgi:hypothetical protein